MRYLIAALAALTVALTACGSPAPAVPAPAPKPAWTPTAAEAEFVTGAREIAPSLSEVRDERLAGWGVDTCSTLEAVDAKTGKPFPRTKVVETVQERFNGRITAAQAGKIADLAKETVCRA